MSGPEPAVLAQLILLQSTLHVLPDDTRLAEFVCAGIRRLPGVRAVAICLRQRRLAATAGFEPDEEQCDGCVGDDTAHPSRPRSAQPAECPLASQPSIDALPIATALQRYGYLLLHLDAADAFAPYRDFVENSLNLVALTVESREQEAELRRMHDDLERRVQQRTAELAAVQREVRERERFIRTVVDLTPALIYTYDLVEQRNLYINAGIERHFGYPPSRFRQWRDRLVAELIHPDDQQRVADHHRQLAAAQEGEVLTLEYRMRRADGVWRVLRSHDAVYDRDERGAPSQLVGVALDVTEQREAEQHRAQLEERLRHAQQLEAVGRLAGGVAHDFNNLLVPILTLSHLVADDMTADDPARADLLEIAEAATRARDLVKQLLAFGRKQMLQRRPVRAAELVERCVPLLRRTIREDVEVVTRCSDDTAWIVCDPPSFEQVLVNLAVNAQDAMPTGGTLTITTDVVQRVPAAALPAGESAEPAGPFVVVDVADTGHGMAPDAAARAFEPFFTTKAQGRGTGLGLAQVYGTVRQQDGYVGLTSVLGEGTSVRLYFPVTEEREGSAEREAASKAARGAPSKAVILVVDDSAEVRAATSQVLRRAGYRVVEAADGQEALAVVRAASEPPDLLVTDIVMPKLSGPALHERLAERFPDLPALYMSGYPAAKLSHHATEPEKLVYLSKPFAPQELLARVAELLNGET